ncbi:hypothetical protein G9A89_002171 [Geosiphon pyriformis]|nr:hypothetical protein G9A89_002171 [Geosiphon pyriformis]
MADMQPFANTDIPGSYPESSHNPRRVLDSTNKQKLEHPGDTPIATVAPFGCSALGGVGVNPLGLTFNDLTDNVSSLTGSNPQDQEHEDSNFSERHTHHEHEPRNLTHDENTRSNDESNQSSYIGQTLKDLTGKVSYLIGSTPQDQKHEDSNVSERDTHHEHEPRNLTHDESTRSNDESNQSSYIGQTLTGLTGKVSSLIGSTPRDQTHEDSNVSERDTHHEHEPRNLTHDESTRSNDESNQSSYIGQTLTGLTGKVSSLIGSTPRDQTHENSIASESTYDNHEPMNLGHDENTKSIDESSLPTQHFPRDQTRESSIASDKEIYQNHGPMNLGYGESTKSIDESSLPTQHFPQDQTRENSIASEKETIHSYKTLDLTDDEDTKSINEPDLSFQHTRQHDSNVPTGPTLHTHQFESNVPTLHTGQFESNVPTQHTHQLESNVPTLHTHQFGSNVPTQHTHQLESNTPIQHADQPPDYGTAALAAHLDAIKKDLKEPSSNTPRKHQNNINHQSPAGYVAPHHSSEYSTRELADRVKEINLGSDDSESPIDPSDAQRKLQRPIPPPPLPPRDHDDHQFGDINNNPNHHLTHFGAVSHITDRQLDEINKSHRKDNTQKKSDEILENPLSTDNIKDHNRLNDGINHDTIRKHDDQIDNHENLGNNHPSKREKMGAALEKTVGTVKEKIGKIVKNDELVAKGLEQKESAALKQDNRKLHK